MSLLSIENFVYPTLAATLTLSLYSHPASAKLTVWWKNMLSGVPAAKALISDTSNISDTSERGEEKYREEKYRENTISR